MNECPKRLHVASGGAIEDVVTIGFLLLVNLSFMVLKVSAKTSSDSNAGGSARSVQPVRYWTACAISSRSQCAHLFSGNEHQN